LNEEVKELRKTRSMENDVNKARYKGAKRIAKKAVAVAKNSAYERLYQRIDPKEGENEVFKLVRARERRTRDLSSIRCIKDDDGKVFKLVNGDRLNIS